MSSSQTSRITSKPDHPRGLAGWRHGRGAVVALVTALAVLPSVSPAQQWILTPEIEIAAQHIDNPRLRETDDTESITGGLLDIAAALRRNTETTNILFRPAVAIYRYSGDTDEDSEAYFLDFSANKQGLRSNWRLDADYQQQQVFRGEITPAEIDDIGIDDTVDTGTGRTFERRQRDRWRIRPGVTFDFTERTALKFDVLYMDVQYDSQALGEAIDYTNARANASIVRALSEDSDLEFGVFAARYEPDSLASETNSTGVRLGYRKAVSDISTFFIDVGAQESEVDSDFAQSDSKTSFVWNIRYDRNWERTRWRFDIGHAVTPSGSGAVVERDLYRATMHHQLQPRWSLRLSAAAMRSETLGEEVLVSSNKRDYLQGRASLGYQLTRKWTIEGLYGFTYQDFEDRPGDGQEHEIRLSLIYRPPLPTQ